jgi:hypothetical protein
MGDNTVDLRLLGEQMRRVLAEQHDMRVDQRMLHERLTSIEKTLGGLIEMFGQFSQAFATTSSRIDALGNRMDQRLERVETALEALRPAGGDASGS